MLDLSRHKLDFIIGLFVLLAAAAAVFIALRAADITDVTEAEGYLVHVQFDNVGGLTERAAVKSSGVRVGRVKAISYDSSKHFAVVELVIEGQYHFPKDSIFSVVSSNLLGGQYVAIEVGAEDEMLQAGDIKRGNSAIVLEDLISKFLFDTAGE